jgi:hypothetical protein
MRQVGLTALGVHSDHCGALRAVLGGLRATSDNVGYVVRGVCYRLRDLD